MGVLAVDCEGHDCAILRGFLEHCKVDPGLLPDAVVFETNGLNDQREGRGTEAACTKAFQNLGYKLCMGGGYKRTLCRNTVLWHPEKYPGFNDPAGAGKKGTASGSKSSSSSSSTKRRRSD